MLDRYCDQSASLAPQTPRAFKLEAVIVCSNYADFLRHTLPHNKFLFDRMVVVTDYEDAATRKLCEYHHVECVPTDVLETRKNKFRKGAGINAGLERLNCGGWVLHLDADIYLPPQTRLLLEKADLDPACIYGVDRFIVKGPEQWDAFMEQPRLQHENDSWTHLNAFPLGTRVHYSTAGGYVPIGFFQLWHPLASGVLRYPEGHTDAGREDGLFALNWPRSRRHLLAEIVGYHLESTDATMAANWAGRKTAPFSLARKVES
jgi:hypothetical protein